MGHDRTENRRHLILSPSKAASKTARPANIERCILDMGAFINRTRSSAKAFSGPGSNGGANLDEPLLGLGPHRWLIRLVVMI